MKKAERYICDIRTFDQFWEVIVKPRGILDTYDGLTCNSVHEIHIADDLDEQRLKEVVYHEVAHAFNNSLYGRRETFTHEQMCDFIGRYGYHIHTQSQIILNELSKEEPK